MAELKTNTEIPIKLDFQIKNSHWMINGKTYDECGFVEKYYFDLFFRYKRREYPTKNK